MALSERRVLVPLPSGVKPSESKSFVKLQKMGFIPVPISIDTPKNERRSRYNFAGGLLLPGGVDIDPSSYNRPDHPKIKNTNKNFDAFELELIEKADKDGMPIMGECRGEQLLNIAWGGSLLQDLPEHTDEKHGLSIEIFDTVYPSSVWHDIITLPGTITQRILGSEPIYAPSRHHQAVDKTGGDLIVSAISPGNIVEIIEHQDPDRFVLGLQTHPELVDNLNAVYTAFGKAIDLYCAAGAASVSRAS